MPVVDSGGGARHVVLVPSEVYHTGVSGCLPGVYSYLQPYQLRRHVNWFDESPFALSEIRAQPLLSLAAIWMLVFALAHQGFNRVKLVLYMMVCIHVATTALLLVRGATLPGALSGLGTMLYADWSYVINFEMWCNALYVSLESVGVTGSIYLGIVRFNNFKNVYQRDVYLVLVADTATGVLRMAITFMYLGHLASAIGTDVRMLVRIVLDAVHSVMVLLLLTESRLVVGILPQAMSAVPYQELWSQVHALWLLSTMLPKFLIVPDIVIELLAHAQPFILLNRTLIHFFVCVTLLMTSVAVCSQGGANVAAIIAHNHDQKLRFVLLFLESIVLLQFYGVRRLDIACRLMTGRECSDFVKVCLTSVIPVIVISLFLAKVASRHSEDGIYPVWIYAVITWFWLVQLSFIPVFAVVLLNDVNMREQTLQNLLIPLPTWVPLNWEHAMYYRKTLVVEGFDTDAARNAQTRLQARSRRSSKLSKRSGNRSSGSSTSSTEIMASDFVVASDRAFAVPGTDTVAMERRAKSDAPPVPSGVASLSGTLHVTRHLSSVKRSAQREILEAPPEQKVSQMPLVSQTEANKPQGVSVVTVPQPICCTTLSFKESCQAPGVVTPPSAKLPNRIGPEASNITNKVGPAGVVTEDDRQEHFDLNVDGFLRKQAYENAAVVAQGGALSKSTGKKLTDMLSLVPSTADGVQRSSKGVPCPDERKLRTADELLPEQCSGEGMEKPADAAAPQVTGGVEVPRTSALEKPRASVASKRSRMSVEQMLMLNKQLPSDSEQETLHSDVHVQVFAAPRPSTVPEKAEGVSKRGQPEGQPAPQETEEPHPKRKQHPLRGDASGAGGPGQNVEAGTGSAGKNATPGASRPSKAKRRRLKLLAKRQAAQQRRLAQLVHHKPTTALLSVERDSAYMRMPATGGATDKQGEQDVPCAVQEGPPERRESRRNSAGLEDSSSAKKSSNSVESVTKAASAEYAMLVALNVEEKSAIAEGSRRGGKRTSRSVSSLRSVGKSAAVNGPRGVPGTGRTLEEDRNANKVAVMAGRDLPKPEVAEAEPPGGMCGITRQPPFRGEGAVIPDCERHEEGKGKTHRKRRKRHHKEATGQEAS